MLGFLIAVEFKAFTWNLLYGKYDSGGPTGPLNDIASTIASTGAYVAGLQHLYYNSPTYGNQCGRIADALNSITGHSWGYIYADVAASDSNAGECICLLYDDTLMDLLDQGEYHVANGAYDSDRKAKLLWGKFKYKGKVFYVYNWWAPLGDPNNINANKDAFNYIINTTPPNRNYVVWLGDFNRGFVTLHNNVKDVSGRSIYYYFWDSCSKGNYNTFDEQKAPWASGTDYSASYGNEYGVHWTGNVYTQPARNATGDPVMPTSRIDFIWWSKWNDLDGSNSPDKVTRPVDGYTPNAGFDFSNPSSGTPYSDHLPVFAMCIFGEDNTASVDGKTVHSETSSFPDAEYSSPSGALRFDEHSDSSERDCRYGDVVDIDEIYLQANGDYFYVGFDGFEDSGNRGKASIIYFDLDRNESTGAVSFESAPSDAYPLKVKFQKPDGNYSMGVDLYIGAWDFGSGTDNRWINVYGVKSVSNFPASDSDYSFVWKDNPNYGGDQAKKYSCGSYSDWGMYEVGFRWGDIFSEPPCWINGADGNRYRVVRMVVASGDTSGPSGAYDFYPDSSYDSDGDGIPDESDSDTPWDGLTREDNYFVFLLEDDTGDGWPDRLSTDTVAPSVNLVSPSNGAYLNSTTVTFVWSGSDDKVGIEKYRVQVATDSSFAEASLVYDGVVSQTNLSLAGFSDGVYYWRVKAYDWAENTGSWSQIWQVGIDTVGPSVVDPVPSDGATVSSPTVNFSWTGSDPYPGSGIANYTIEIDTDGDPTTWEVIDITTSSSYTYTFASDGIYYWRVTATDRAGNTSPPPSGIEGNYWKLTVNTASVIPTPISPVSESTNDSTPTFVWSDEGADEYWIQVDDDNNFTSPVYNETGILTNSWTPTSALADGTYYWRVRAYANGIWYEWSSVATFSVDTVAPSTPVLTSPQNDTWTGDNTPTFTWGNVSDADSYEIQISQYSDFSSIEFDSNLNVTSWTSGPLSEGVHYWRVRAIDEAGNAGDWSQKWIVKIDTIPPERVSLSSPGNSTWVNESTPTFTWVSSSDSGSGVESYEIQIGDSEDFSSLFADEKNITTTSWQSPPLSDGAYYWRVRAIDSVGNYGNWSSAWVVKIDTAAPSVPSGVDPDGNITNSLTIVFRWTSATDSGSGVSGYDVQVSTSSDFSAIVTNATDVPDTNWTATLSEGSYYWRVRAKDNAGNVGSWSASLTFRIDTTAPGVPVLLAPADGTWSSDSTPTFQWSAPAPGDSDVSYYEVEIYNSTWSYVWTSNTTVSTIPVSLSEGQYNWHVRAYDVAGNPGSWSSAWSLGIDLASPQVNLLSPVSGSWFSSLTVQLLWNSTDTASGIEAQRILIATDPAFSGVVVDQNLTAFSFTFDAPAEGTYYWKVEASDFTGHVGYSPVWNFTVDLTPPDGLVKIVFPPDGYTTASTSLILSWSWNGTATAENFHHYEVIVVPTTQDEDSASAFSDLSDSIYWSSFTDPAITQTPDPVIFPTDGFYYMRIRVYDSAGNHIEDVSKFLIDSVPPDAVSLSSPADGSWVNSKEVYLKWNAPAATDIAYYLAEISLDSTFPSNLTRVYNTTSLSYGISVASDGVYYWRVKAVDFAESEGNYSEVWVFKVDSTPPEVSLLGISRGTVLEPGENTITWEAGDSFSGISYYQVYIDDQKVYQGEQNSITYKFKPGRHTIKVLAYDVSGNSASTQVEVIVRSALSEGQAKLYPVPFVSGDSVKVEYGYDAHKDPVKAVLYVYDILGHLVVAEEDKFADGILPWHGRTAGGGKLVPGIYMYRVVVYYADGTKTVGKAYKMIVLGR